MRPRQWLKNALIFIPLLAAHAMTWPALLPALLAFLAFCLCASSAYLLNDVLDVAHDRLHPSKRFRPIAAGLVSPARALLVSALLGGAGLGLAAYGGVALLDVVLLYFVSTVLYSVYLKKILLIDVAVLAGLYTVRLVGGGVASAIALSFWLLSFSFFLFLSLALLKRHNELLRLKDVPEGAVPGRGYLPRDCLPVAILGMSAGVISTLVLILYYNSVNMVRLYQSPALLVFIVPLFFIWLARLWVLSFRGAIDEDPVLHVSRDKASLAIIALCLALGAAASF